MTQELTIIGGTGHLSTRMVRILIAKGMKLKLVARNPDKARDLFGDAVTVVPGDVADPGSLTKALEGSQAVYIHLNTEALDPDQEFYTEREGVLNIVKAAEESGVSHLIQIAGMESFRPEFFAAGVIETERIRSIGMAAVASSSIPHTFVCCSFFLDSLPRFINEGMMAIFGDADASKIHFTNTDQLAGHLYHITGNPTSFGRRLPVQGQEALSLPEAARRFFETYDSGVSVQPLPLEAIDSFGLPPEVAGFMKHVSEVTAGMREEFVAGDVHGEFGAPVLTIEEFAGKLRQETES